MNVEQFAVNRKLVPEAVDRWLVAIVSAVEHHFGDRMGQVKVVLCAAALSLLVSFPLYKEFGRQLDEDPVIAALEVKFHNPLAAIPANLKDAGLNDGAASHNDKLELRLTVPILGWLSHTGKWTVVVWSPVCALVVFYLLAKLAGKALEDDVGGALFVLALAPTFFGAWFFNDIDYGDAVAFLFLVLAIASTNPLLTSAAVVAAAFTDERCVTAAPLLFLYFAVSLRGDQEKSRRRGQYFAIVVGLVLWLVLRWWIAHTWHLTMGTSRLGSLSIIKANLMQKLPYGFFDIFKTLWTLPLVAAIWLWLGRKWLAWLAFVGVFSIAAVPALLVVGFDRSLCYTFPIPLTSLYFLPREKVQIQKCLAAMLVLNLLFISPGNSILRIAAWWR